MPRFKSLNEKLKLKSKQDLFGWFFSCVCVGLFYINAYFLLHSQYFNLKLSQFGPYRVDYSKTGRSVSHLTYLLYSVCLRFHMSLNIKRIAKWNAPAHIILTNGILGLQNYYLLQNSGIECFQCLYAYKTGGFSLLQSPGTWWEERPCCLYWLAV